MPHPGNETEDLANYAIIDGEGVIVNIVWSGPGFAAEQDGWIKVGHLNPEPGIGWRTTDGGASWEEPEFIENPDVVPSTEEA